ncbi:MAG TPA: DNA topology modulation protein [Pyrinomonadaceae bacterium]|nr:DNA topology modulation protein [Pyrinomonadaceae bacterium]
MKKVLIIGPGGAGKSTIARRLGELLQIEVFHLDRHYWQPGWVEPPKNVWQATVEQLLSREAWIIDGNYSGTLSTRLQACDTVIFLDLSRVLCVWRIIRRRLMYRKVNRPDMAAGCEERLSPEFLGWVWNYSRRSRPKVVALLKAHEKTKKIVWLRSRTEVERFLNTDHSIP